MAYSSSHNYRPQDHARHDSFVLRPHDNSGYGSLPRSSGTFLDSRYNSPSLPPRASSYSYPPRRKWPPAPSVEDEAESLKREHGSDALVKQAENGGEGEACKGTTDQEPILIEVALPNQQNHERRFVHVSNQSPQTPSTSDSTTHHGTAPQPRLRKKPQEKDMRKVPALQTKFDDIPEFAQRTPSRYSYAGTPGSSHRSSAEYFLSPELASPPSASIPRSSPHHASQVSNGHKKNDGSPSNIEQPPLPPRKNTSSSQKQTKPGSKNYDSSSDESVGRSGRTTSSRYGPSSPRPSFGSHGEPRPGHLRAMASQSFAPQQARPSIRVPTRHASFTTADATRPSPTLSAPFFSQNSPIDKQQRPCPPPIPVPNRGDSSRTPASSRPSSRLGQEWTPSPPSTPFLAPNKAETFPRDSRSRPGSRYASREVSPNSPSLTRGESMPVQPSLDFSQANWGSPYGSSSNNRPAPAFRWDTAATAPRIDVKSPSPAPPASTSLPYPVDDLEHMMPSESQYQHLPNGLGSAFEPPQRPSSSASGRPQTAADRVAARPSISASKSTGTVPQIKTGRGDTSPGINSKSPRTETESMPKTLPPCSRTELSSKYDDWYIMEDLSTFTVCPDCLDEIVYPSKFRKSFKRARRQRSGEQTKCSFSSPWIRLAWLLTFEQKRSDIDLVYAMGMIDASGKVCPGKDQISGSCYGLLDKSGNSLTDFTLCACDRMRIEALLPSLEGVFSRMLSSESKQSRYCSLRIENEKFPILVDALIAIDAEAQRKQRKPEMRSFVDLTGGGNSTCKKEPPKEQLPECTKDTLFLDKKWHYMSTLPELTICTSCYDGIIRPTLKSGSDLADMFMRTPKLVPGAQNSQYGESCQIYSPRMRRVWAMAAKDDDLKYLKRKVRERRDAEVKIAEARELVLWRLKGLRNGSGEKERLEWELEKLEREWREWE
ncbi:hypothetical protein K402DRAFT_372564 [Aulographum hederae CBS 113979]|uniref:Uncharacterized protein n=1 Tax=Aulographum hederae CBS 113979 TaxID=1176131 RepID=A0A6G1H7L5_9PEZI|nr:hypothetical protein K402DRAFT_372564 [Aulographum hederae CBS 113979]